MCVHSRNLYVHAHPRLPVDERTRGNSTSNQARALGSRTHHAHALQRRWQETGVEWNGETHRKKILSSFLSFSRVHRPGSGWWWEVTGGGVKWRVRVGDDGWWWEVSGFRGVERSKVVSTLWLRFKCWGDEYLITEVSVLRWRVSSNWCLTMMAAGSRPSYSWGGYMLALAMFSGELVI